MIGNARLTLNATMTCSDQEEQRQDCAHPPFCSVIIPAFNASSTLALCLESITRLDYPSEKLEIIVIDNGSTDNSAEIAQKFDVKLLAETTIQSSYAARNKGIREAKGELIAFTDADCIVTPGWLKYLVAYWDDETIGCFAGEIEAYQPESLVEKFSDREGILRQRCTLDSPYLPYPQTANAAYRKLVFDQVGLFIPEMTSGGDADIAWRMQRQIGLKIRFVPEALVYHKHRTSLQGLYNQYHRYECGKFYWTKLYPDYPFASVEQRKLELERSIHMQYSALKRNILPLANNSIDLVDFVSPFFKALIHAATFKARVDIDKEHNDFSEDKITGSPSWKSEEDTIIEELTSTVESLQLQLQQQVDGLNGIIAVKDRIIAEKDDVIAAKNEVIRLKEARIADLLDSLSWKITSPLRWIHTFFFLGGFKKTLSPHNSKIGLFLDLISLAIREPKALLKNLTISNIHVFFREINNFEPSAFGTEVKNKIYQLGPYAQERIVTNNFDYFGMFKIKKDDKNILVIDRFIPAYDTNSGALRMFTILTILSELGYHVTFIPDDLQPREPYVNELESAGVRVICGDVNVEEHLRLFGPSYAIVILSEPQPAFNFISLVRAYAMNSKVIYDTVDIHWLRLERAASVTRDKRLLEEAEYFRKIETLNIDASDIIWTVTQDEKDLLLGLNPGLSVEVLPNIHEVTTEMIKPFPDRKDIMFIGHFLHDPNIDAVTYFVSEIFPLLKTFKPDMKFYIVGSNPTKEVLALASDDVIVTGYVKDVTPYFANCRLFVAPLRFGAGMKGKIGQSMVHGLPVVTTTIGAEGMGLHHGENVLIADTATEFAAAVTTLYADQDLWDKLSIASREHIDRNYSKKAISEKAARMFKILM